MSWFLSITNLDELKMVPEGQTHVQCTSPRVVVYMSCARARHCLPNIYLSRAQQGRHRTQPLTSHYCRHSEVLWALPVAQHIPILLMGSRLVRTLAEGNLIMGQTPEPPKPVAILPQPVPRPHAYGKATTLTCRTSNEDTESPGQVIPLIQNILICSLVKTFLGVENYLIKICRHYLRPKVWLTFIILIPREVYFTLGFVLPLIEAGPSKQKRKHVEVCFLCPSWKIDKTNTLQSDLWRQARIQTGIGWGAVNPTHRWLIQRAAFCRQLGRDNSHSLPWPFCTFISGQIWPSGPIFENWPCTFQ